MKLISRDSTNTRSAADSRHVTGRGIAVPFIAVAHAPDDGGAAIEEAEECQCAEAQRGTEQQGHKPWCTPQSSICTSKDIAKSAL